MANIIRRPIWHDPSLQVTAEHVFLRRREFIRRLAVSGAGSAVVATLPHLLGQKADRKSPYPATRNADFDPQWKLTDAQVAGRYNNFYEFTTTKDEVRHLAQRLQIDPWPVKIGGLVENPITLDVKELIEQMPLEERVYRLRCVEAWAMVVPWTGFPLKLLLAKVKPKPEAKFVKFVTFFRPDQAPGQRRKSYPWPYTEGLRIDEAWNDLTLLATGLYGKPMPKQHGAPIRLVVPWKYGYKSIKSIVAIELVKEQPATLWETLAPQEYPFESNVDPMVPHPRWSQAFERMIDTGRRVRTKKYNGYADQVAALYE